MTADFEILNHTADIGIIARGQDVRETFINAARGLFSLVIDPEEVSVKKHREISITAPDREALLVNWLNELIYLLDAEEVLFKDFKIIEITGTRLKVKAGGERINTKKHHLRREVKAATYHQLKIEQTAEGWRAQVIFDI
ncbi:MAG TPA: archease [Dehalococcoidales bacterium]